MVKQARVGNYQSITAKGIGKLEVVQRVSFTILTIIWLTIHQLQNIAQTLWQRTRGIYNVKYISRRGRHRSPYTHKRETPGLHLLQRINRGWRDICTHTRQLDRKITNFRHKQTCPAMAHGSDLPDPYRGHVPGNFGRQPPSFSESTENGSWMGLPLSQNIQPRQQRSGSKRSILRSWSGLASLQT